MPILSEEEYAKLTGIIAKDETAEAEKARFALIDEKNAELDQKLAAVALLHQKTMDIANAKLKLAEDAVEASEAAAEALDEAITERKAVIEIIASACAVVEQEHYELYADIYNPQGAG